MCLGRLDDVNVSLHLCRSAPPRPAPKTLTTNINWPFNRCEGGLRAVSSRAARDTIGRCERRTFSTPHTPRTATFTLPLHGRLIILTGHMGPIAARESRHAQRPARCWITSDGNLVTVLSSCCARGSSGDESSHLFHSCRKKCDLNSVLEVYCCRRVLGRKKPLVAKIYTYA